MPVPEVVGKVCPGPGAADSGFIFVTRAWTVDINLKPPMLELKNEHVSFAHALQSRLFSPFFLQELPSKRVAQSLRCELERPHGQAHAPHAHGTRSSQAEGGQNSCKFLTN